MIRQHARNPLAAVLLAFAALAAASACGDAGGGEEAELPSATALENLYGTTRATAEVSGNVVDVRVRQDPQQLERGGRLWARVGPYIYLFSPQTQELFGRWSGVAAVRVRTVIAEGGPWIAEAMLRRDALNALTWRDARRVVAKARTEGTDRPGYMEDLIDYGEDRTEYRYNPEYAGETP